MTTQGDQRAPNARGHPFSRWLPALVLVAACGGGSTRDPGGAAVPYDLVYAGQQSGVESPLREVARTENQWAAVWGRITTDRSPAPPLPEVDFERYMLIAVGLGTRPSGGYAVRIASATAGSDALTVTVEEVAPGAGCIATMALTAPVVVVRVERFDEEVAFAETREERPCD